jgi:hypothetical protein
VTDVMLILKLGVLNEVLAVVEERMVCVVSESTVLMCGSAVGLHALMP